jgi:hypothetical protein
MHISAKFLVLTTALLIGACGDDDSNASFSSAEPIVLGEGDIRISNRQGAIDLMLLGDQIVVGFSDSLLAEIEAKTDTSQLESSGGVGASIERFVKSKVQGTLSKRLEYPVADLRDVSYDGRRIRFDYEPDASFSMLENMEVEDTPLLASFSEEDSRRFVQAVKARLRAERT